VLNAEGNPTVTLALTSFVAPFLLWIGGTLLLLRVVGRLLAAGRFSALLGRMFGAGGELAARSLSSRAAAASRAIVLMALAVSFATSTLTFDATYRQQQRVDAALSLGADLKAVPTTALDASAATTVSGPGVAAVSPFVDRVVYVGSEAQDLLGIDPASLPRVATLSNSFFEGTSAAAAMQALATQPDAIFVSAETAKDYSIVPGDRIRIRVPDAHGQLHDVDFHMVGIALEFPTAPKDAFLVANLDYVATQSGNTAISFVLASANGDPSATAVGRRLGPTWTVTDLRSTDARLANSVTSVDLAALVSLDVGFAILIASLGVALFLLAGLSERKRELATLDVVITGAEYGHGKRAGLLSDYTFAVRGPDFAGPAQGGRGGRNHRCWRRWCRCRHRDRRARRRDAPRDPRRCVRPAGGAAQRPGGGPRPRDPRRVRRARDGLSGRWSRDARD
jgi:putative ABC transport system permease protein